MAMNRFIRTINGRSSLNLAENLLPKRPGILRKQNWVSVHARIEAEAVVGGLRSKILLLASFLRDLLLLLLRLRLSRSFLLASARAISSYASSSSAAAEVGGEGAANWQAHQIARRGFERVELGREMQGDVKGRRPTEILLLLLPSLAMLISHHPALKLGKNSRDQRSPNFTNRPLLPFAHFSPCISLSGCS